MSKVTTKAIAKVAAVATGLAMATSMLSLAPIAHAASLSDAQVQSILSLLSSFGADSATIANVQAALTGQASTGGSTSTGGSMSSCSFTRDLTTGVSGDDVTCLQKALMAAGYSIPAISSGAASYGYFGSQTVSAVIAWQKAAGVSPASGYFGPISRAHWNLSGGSTGGNGGVGAGTGNGLKVSLAATSPNGSVLVQGQGIGDLGEFTFANPTSAPISVTALTFNRTGVSNDSTLTNVYLYNNGTRLTDSAGISSGQFSFTNAAGLFTVPAGMTYTVAVRSDIANNTSGQQLGVSLVSVSSTGTLDSSVSFPIMSGYQTISAASLATVNFDSNVIPSGTPNISPQSDYTVWQDTVSVSTNPVKLASMRFTNLGSADASALTNLRLYVDGTQVGSAVTSVSADRTVTFDLSSAPVTLSTQSHVIKVLANVVGGASRTIQFSVQRSSDAMFVDAQLNQPVTPTYGSGPFTSANSGTITINSTGTSGVSVNRSPSSPINNIPVGASNVKLASFDMLASGEPTKVMDLFVCADTSVHNGGLDNGKVYFNGVQVGSTKDISECSSYTDFSLGSSLILPAGQTATVDVYADAKTSTSTNLSNNETVKVTLHGTGSLSNGQGQSSLTSTNVPSSDIAGNLISVTSSSLTATKFSGYADQTMIPGSNNVRLGAFTLSAGATEDVNVNTITISASTTPSGELTNLTLKDDATGNTIGNVISTPSTSNSFSVNLTVPMSSTKTISVYGNIRTNAATSIQLGIPSNGITGTGASTGTTATANATMLQTITVGSGTLSVGIGASNPVSANVIAGTSALTVGDFTFNGVNSPWTVQKLEVDVPAASAAAISTLSIQYKDANGVTQTVSQALQATNGSTSTAQFSGLNFFVPMNDSADVTVMVSTPTVASGGNISGKKIVVALPATPLVSNAFQAVDSAGNATTTPYTWTTDVNSNKTAGYGTLVVHKSIPTFAMQTLTSTIPVAGQAVYRVNVTADPAGAVDIDKFSFNVATTSGATLSTFGLYDVTGGTATQLGTSQSANSSNVVSFSLGSSYQQIGAGSTKTYELRPNGTVSWSTGGSLTVSLAQDTTYAANNDVSSLSSSKIIWSDRSSTTHASSGTSATDWSNGYLLKDFVSDITSFTYHS